MIDDRMRGPVNGATVWVYDERRRVRDDVASRLGADRPCLHQPGHPTWSYAELLVAANRVARVLTEDLGIVSGNRVLLRGYNGPELYAAWLRGMDGIAPAATETLSVYITRLNALQRLLTELRQRLEIAVP